MLGLCALICGWIMLMLPTLHRKSGRVFKAEGEKGAYLVETLQGIRTIKSLALDAAQAARVGCAGRQGGAISASTRDARPTWCKPSSCRSSG